MTVLMWFIGVVLIVLSFVLWVAGLTGREGVLRIGRLTLTESRKQPKTGFRRVKLSNVVVGIIGFSVGLEIILILAI